MPQIDIKQQLLRLNLDDDYFYLGKADYIDVLNITHDAKEQSEDIANTNITGNRLVPYNKPAGTSATIGAKADIKNNRVFEFNWNSNNYHSIVIFDLATRTRTKLIENLTDTNGVDVLQFTKNNKINHCDIIYRGTDEGDLLFWTDGNVSPRKLNVKHIQDRIYTYLKVPFIELAKMPPVIPIQAVYGTDASRSANSLRKKLVMATYRWCYNDYEKSTPTTYSKVPLPVGYYGSDNDSDNTKNNFITFTVTTGDENVTSIEILVRFNSDNVWQDFILAVSLNKAQLNIPNNSTYDYLFYNDSIYPPVDVIEATQLFDWVPKKALSQCCGNGNTIELAAITENFSNYPVNEIDVTITVENLTNIPPDNNPPSITYTQTSPTIFVFTVNGGTVPVGTIYKIYIFFNGNSSLGQTYGVRLVATYTSIAGDTTNSVALALSNQFNAYPSVPTIAVSYASNYWQASFGVAGCYPQQISVTPGSTAGTISTEKTWLWDANYIFGIAYKDEQGRVMPGVTTFVNPTNSSNDFLVTTPTFSVDGSFNVQTPVITASIMHLPPAGAVTYAWVRRRMTYANFLMYETSALLSDTDFLYFDLANIEKYKVANSQFIYGTAPITSESRIRIIAGITTSAYNGNVWNQDYEILGLVTKTPSGGTSPADDVPFIKVKKPAAAISPAYTANMLVMVYTPMANPTSIEDSVYWEWGEEYGIYSIAGVNYHRGMTQDQTGAQPAIFVWEEGDVYLHERTMFVSSIASGTTTDTVPVMDSNFSDFFLSAVNDNGRGLTIEPDAHETFYPATVRFSLEYQQYTNINQTNRFKFDNFIDCDRSFGSILKMSIRDRYIRVGQQYKLGSIPIFNQISKDSAGNTLVAATDVLLNPIQYYLGDYGVGDAPECWVDFNYSSYGFDTNRGIWWRLSRDGVQPISILYKMNSWCTDHGVSRGANYKIYGAYDPKANNCIFAFEPTGSDAAYTLSFDEDNNAFESFLSYHPEMMCTIGSLLITWRNGDLYTHDSLIYNNFYGVQYPSYIQTAFNNQPAVKKKFLALGYASLNNTVWDSPDKGDVATNMVNPQTNMKQQSSITQSDYQQEESMMTAPFNFDINSRVDAREGLRNGDFLNGNYILVKFVCDVTKSSALVNLSEPYITWIPSGRNF